MRLIKKGLFWRIEVAKNTISKKRFLTESKALWYIADHQNRDGFPVIKKEKK